MATPITSMVIGLGGSGSWTVAHVKRMLMDAYDNRIPNNVALTVLDTADKSLAKVGSSGDTLREEGMGLGAVTLKTSEYIHVGGDAHSIVERTANSNDYPHIKSWLLADHYLRDLPRSTLLLDTGAGQYRQLGRLALFRAVAQPANSPITAVLETKITQIARRANNTISVFIIGSLTGGTGAGMFIDAAHIVRRVASVNNLKVTLYGFFYLPQAFRRNIDAGQYQYAKMRAFAAMRELKRFLLSEDFKFGYPMYYHRAGAGVDERIWRAHSTEKIYDFVYLIDGEGETRLNDRALEEGSAAAAADAIVNFIDPSYGPVNEQLMKNLPARVGNRQKLIGKKALVSALGSYSIVLPVQQMIEGWAYQLGLELMRSIITPKDLNPQGMVLNLDSNQHPEQRDEDPLITVRRILTSRSPMIDPSNSQRQIVPTLLWEAIYRFFDKYNTGEQSAIRELSAYTVRDWFPLLVPEQGSSDPESTQALREVGQYLTSDVQKVIQTSDQREPRGDPREDHRDIAARAEQFITQNLGAVGTGGGRTGGQYGDSLARFRELQLRRIREYTAAHIMHTLNGSLSNSADPIAAKTGRLGWLISYYTTQRNLMAKVSDLLERVRSGAAQTLTNQRRMVDDAKNKAKDEMIKEAPRVTAIIGTSPAIKAQQQYLARVQDYVVFYRGEFARQYVADTVAKMVVFFDQVLIELNRWAQALATNTHSLYNEMLRGYNRALTERQKASKVANQKVIEDRTWEEERFAEYVDKRQRKDMLYRAWQWNTNITNEKLGLNVQFGGQELGQMVQLRADLDSEAWWKRNIDNTSALLRTLFASAVQERSVLEYLLYKYRDNPDALGSELARNSGYLLSINENVLAEGRVATYILLAKSDEASTEQQSFLSEVRQALGAHRGLGNLADQDSALLRVVQCADPFRMTLLTTGELIALEGINAYGECKVQYEQTPYDGRQEQHIFPAEIRSITYERDINRMRDQSARLLEDRVSLLLENEDRFIEFLFLLVSGIASQYDLRQGGAIRLYWGLRLPATDRRRVNEYDDIYLTLANDAPSLLEAAMTYVLIGEDYRGFLDKAQPKIAINYEYVQKYLTQVRREDAAERIERDALGLGDDEVRRWIEYFMPPLDANNEPIFDGWNEKAFVEVAELVVQYDMGEEMIGQLNAQLPSLKSQVEQARNGVSASDGNSHDALRIAQEMYDFYTISMIALNRETEKLRQIIKRRYEVKAGMQPSL